MESSSLSPSPASKLRNVFRGLDKNMTWLAVVASVALHVGSIGWMAWKSSEPEPAPQKPNIAKVRILANPNGNPNITQTKAVEIAKPKPKPKPNARNLTKAAPKEEPQEVAEEVNNAPQSFGDDPTGGVVGTGFSTTDGSSDPGATANAEPIERVKPEFPQEAALKGIEGWVLLRFDITEEGRVENIEVINANPRNMFERKARDAVKKWKYAPRMANGQAVKVIGREVQIDFKFDS